MRKEARWMKHNKWLAIASVLVLLGVSLPAVARDQSVVVAVVDGSEAPPLRIPDGFFTENAGQVSNEHVRFYSTGGMQAGFAESAVLVKLVERDHARPLDVFEERMRVPQVQRDNPPSVRGVMVRITFPGSNKVMPQGVQEMPHRSNYFIGNDPSKWRTGVRSYQEIVYKDLYEGIDLSYSTQDGQLKYEFIVGLGADPAIIRVSYEGVEGIRLDQSGELVVSTALGELRDGKPIAYQGGNGVECAFVQRGPLTFGFRCEGRDSSRPLVIDPLVYATYLGDGYEGSLGIAADSSGSAYVTGWTSLPDFPVTNGSFDTAFNGYSDVFIAKLNATGTALIYATFLGGGMWDTGQSITVDSSGDAYVTGETHSIDFPATSGSVDSTYNGDYDVFVAKLDAAGSVLIYATYLGGGGEDTGLGIAVDPSGNASVTGVTNSTDFPATPGSFDTTYNGGWRTAFVAKLDATASALVYATYLGGSNDDTGFGIAVDSSSNAYVGGKTSSADFPATPGSFDTIYNGSNDGFVAKLNAAGSALIYATFLGGANSDSIYGIAVDSSGNAYMTGWTFSDRINQTYINDFPVTPGSFDTTVDDWSDSFVAKLNMAGSALVYATFLGGGSEDKGAGIAVDSSGNAYVTGDTYSFDFPAMPGSFDTTYNGGVDAFVAKLSAAGSALIYATFLGGRGADGGSGIAVDPSDIAYVTGNTNSVDFPVTPGAFDMNYSGADPFFSSDAFVAKLTLLPMPVLSATREPYYSFGGLDPEAGIAGVTSFVYRVNYTDADNDTPSAGDPRVHVLKGGFEIAGSPYSMSAADPADVIYSDGKLYTFATALSQCGDDYSYYFTASDSTGDPAPSWPSPPPNRPSVACPNHPPVLEWTGEANYVSDGLNPEAGQNDTTSFVFRVKYSDADNDTPAAGYPKLHLQKPCGTDIAGGPLVMAFSSWVGGTDDYVAGAAYQYSTTIAVPGTDYGYYLQANDSKIDVRLPSTGCVDAPDVAAPVVNHPPFAEAGGPYSCQAGETMTFNGSGSTDPDNDNLTYQWTVNVTPAITLSGQKPTFTCPATEGTFNVSLTVNDSGGLSDTDYSQLSIQPAREVAVDWTWLIVILIAVVAVLVILFLLIRRKKRGEETKEKEKASESPPKSSS